MPCVYWWGICKTERCSGVSKYSNLHSIKEAWRQGASLGREPVSAQLEQARCKWDQGDISVSLALGTTGGQPNVLGIQKVPNGTPNMSWCWTIEKCKVWIQQRSGTQRRICKTSEGSFRHNRECRCCVPKTSCSEIENIPPLFKTSLERHFYKSFKN